MNYIVNSLAQYEVHVARYYYSRGAYLAAINRAQIALADYREVPALEEALYIMVKSYDALGMKELRDDTQRVLTTNYPQSTYLANGFKRQGRSVVEGLVNRNLRFNTARIGSELSLRLIRFRASASSAALKSDSFSRRRIGGSAASSRRP
jgi:hypothetical protein